MRLIDADAYAIEMKKRQDACRKWKSEQNKGGEMYARAEQAFVTFVEAWVTLENQPTIPAIPVEWMDAQIHGYASRLQSTELKALLIVKGLWEKEQEAR